MIFTALQQSLCVEPLWNYLDSVLIPAIQKILLTTYVHMSLDSKQQCNSSRQFCQETIRTKHLLVTICLNVLMLLFEMQYVSRCSKVWIRFLGFSYVRISFKSTIHLQHKAFASIWESASATELFDPLVNLIRICSKLCNVIQVAGLTRSKFARLGRQCEC